MAIVIRDCAETDLDAVQAIYAIEVLEGTASFEIDPPDLEILSMLRPGLAREVLD